MAARMLTKRGDGGLSMPLRAFSIASLVLGAGVCAMGGTLWASGIREVRPSIFSYINSEQCFFLLTSCSGNVVVRLDHETIPMQPVAFMCSSYSLFNVSQQSSLLL